MHCMRFMVDGSAVQTNPSIAFENSFASPESGSQTSDDLLHLCWKQQECWECLRQGPCSWCPTVSHSIKSHMPKRQLTTQTSSCVPNPSTIHILAPISNPGICPLRSERWELRARCLGCQVSTLTFITSIISVCSTLALIGLVTIGIKGVRRFKRWKSQNSDWWKVWRFYRPGWWRRWRLRLVPLGEQDSADRRPLLADA